jgi:hypothetical protein
VLKHRAISQKAGMRQDFLVNLVATMNNEQLHAFIVRAKTATYVGSGAQGASSRPGSHDLRYSESDWLYIDSYFGGTDFIGQEAVFFQGKPTWAMNYYGYILRPDLLSAAEAGAMIKASLSRMYTEGRFLGGFRHSEGSLTYTDTSEGDFGHFQGREWIEKDGVRAYELVYHGGLVKD